MFSELQRDNLFILVASCSGGASILYGEFYSALVHTLPFFFTLVNYNQEKNVLERFLETLCNRICILIHCDNNFYICSIYMDTWIKRNGKRGDMLIFKLIRCFTVWREVCYE